MKYAIMVIETPDELAKRQGDEAYWGAYSRYSAALSEAGVSRPGGMLLDLPTHATTVRLRDGDRVVHDGPFVDSKEQLGGVFVIEVNNLDEALTWAAKCPSSETGAVEVRPILPAAPA